MRPVLYCNCANAENIDGDVKETVLEALRCCARPVFAVQDLCGLAVAGDPRLKEIADAGHATIIACYPRAVTWLFHRLGLKLDAERVEFLNMRTQPAGEIVAALQNGSCGQADRELAITGAASSSSWRPWFPVIDYDRCVNCRQCLEFCLFGVYSIDESGSVAVQKPSACKNNCPACARMCPHIAIMFPKINENSPIGGNESSAESAVGKVCLTKEELFGGNALATLRARRNQPSLLKSKPSQEQDDTAVDQTHDP